MGTFYITPGDDTFGIPTNPFAYELSAIQEIIVACSAIDTYNIELQVFTGASRDANIETYNSKWYLRNAARTSTEVFYPVLTYTDYTQYTYGNGEKYTVFPQAASVVIVNAVRKDGAAWTVEDSETVNAATTITVQSHKYAVKNYHKISQSNGYFALNGNSGSMGSYGVWQDFDDENTSIIRIPASTAAHTVTLTVDSDAPSTATVTAYISMSHSTVTTPSKYYTTETANGFARDTTSAPSSLTNFFQLAGSSTTYNMSMDVTAGNSSSKTISTYYAKNNWWLVVVITDSTTLPSDPDAFKDKIHVSWT